MKIENVASSQLKFHSIFSRKELRGGLLGPKNKYTLKESDCRAWAICTNLDPSIKSRELGIILDDFPIVTEEG